MIAKLASFKVRRADLEHCLEAIRAFVAASRDEPGTLVLSSFRKRDGVSFVHTMVFADAVAERAHQTAAPTRAFVDALFDRCEEALTFTELELVADRGVAS